MPRFLFLDHVLNLDSVLIFIFYTKSLFEVQRGQHFEFSMRNIDAFFVAIEYACTALKLISYSVSKNVLFSGKYFVVITCLPL